MKQSNENSEPSNDSSRARSSCQYLTFQVWHQTFCIDITRIREIIEYGDIARVPLMPDFISGIIDVRGNIVPVVDLSRRLGGPKVETTKKTSIVIIELTEESLTTYLGVIVDAVNEVREIPVEDIEPAPTFGANIRSDFLQGMGRVDGELLIILEISGVLSIQELSVVSEIQDSKNEQNH